MGVLLLGLDGFRLINDTLGHAAGDQLLREVGERLQQLVHGSNTLARPGGDEFSIFVQDADLVQMEELAGQVLEALRRPFHVAGQEVYVSCSIGICFYPEDGRDNESLLRNAHVALHQAKEEGRNTYRLYRRQLNEDAGYRLALRSDLRQALDRGEFVLYLQPKVETSSGLVTSAEALLRWVHPQRGMISPVVFIPLLEETGLIEPVGEWVLEESCAIIRRLQEQGFRDFTVAANLSPRQFHQQDLAQRIGQFIGRHGLRAEEPELELEITESMLMRHEAQSMDLLRQLHEMGIRLAIDDFGTGYSSLSYLTRFPVDYLKIDRSFITQIGHSQEGETVVRAVISMARDLGLKVIAEGVETRIQLEFLRIIGCDLIQGYLFSPPVPEEELARMLERQARGERIGAGKADT
ncbi:MAG: EAL domain-containing protein [Gammaproteobacteria bacterium]|nr:MAG: EAL domain-containing protein [Gammaproteobacteria bacterium]